MRLNNSLVLPLFTVLCSAVVVDSFKYLAVLHSIAKSHFIVGESLMKALAAKGHEVYVISPFPQKQPINNYYDIPLEIGNGHINGLFDQIDGSIFETMLNLLDIGEKINKYVLTDPNVQQLMASNRTFDAVICEIFFSETLYGLSEHFNAPLIGLSVLGASSYDTDMVGSPSPLSYTPNMLLKLTDRMSFIERVLNLALIASDRLFMELYYLRRQAFLYRQYFPNSTRDMYTVRRNAAAVLLNTHVSFAYPRPYMPNHIEVGGMHINRSRQRLPLTMRKFIEEAKHGVVYFSMGSILRSRDMTASQRQAFLTAFSKIKQRVLWKHEDQVLVGKPANVFISNWFPQNDILAHENVKVFITHAGHLSIIESIYHATPIIGIPAVGDHFFNMLKPIAEGFAVQLNYDALNAQNLIQAINLVIGNITYTQRAKEVSARYRDQPLPPKDLAIFWAEHIARHKGAKYLHCPGLDLNFIQYHNIDILMIISCIVLTCIFIICWALKHLGQRIASYLRKGIRKTGKKRE